MKSLYIVVLAVILIAFLIFVPIIPQSERPDMYGSITFIISDYGGVLSPAVGNKYVYEFKTGVMTGICTMEAMRCPDGSFVGRNASNNCKFDPCPSPTTTVTQ